MRKENTISIFIDTLRVHVRIGLYESERKTPQALDVSMELRVAPDYLISVDKNTIIDYGRVHDAIMAWEQRDHVDLIETFAHEALDLGFAFDAVQEVFVQISKPDILKTARGAGVRIDINRAGYEALKTSSLPMHLVQNAAE